MSLRVFLDKAGQAGKLTVISDETDPHLEMARVISRLEGQPLLFESVRGYEQRVAASLCGARENLC